MTPSSSVLLFFGIVFDSLCGLFKVGGSDFFEIESFSLFFLDFFGQMGELVDALSEYIHKYDFLCQIGLSFEENWGKGLDKLSGFHAEYEDKGLFVLLF